MIYDFHQDDPRRCTAGKLERFHLAKSIPTIRRIPSRAIVLNPASNLTISMEDRSLIQQYGLVGIDCSWNLSDTILHDNIRGENRRLPTLLAGNPTNYATRGKLSTAEALAAALIITGFNERAAQLLRLFSWGKTFLSLNEEPLRDYAKALPSQIVEREREYFPSEEA